MSRMDDQSRSRRPESGRSLDVETSWRSVARPAGMVGAVRERPSVVAERGGHALRHRKRLRRLGIVPTERQLGAPSVRSMLRVAWRTFRLRCAHCGKGRVLRSYRVVSRRCSSCGLRFWRGDYDYFSGALLFGMKAGAVLGLMGLLLALVLAGLGVPWRALQVGGSLLLLVSLAAFVPVAKVAWIATDVLLRPVLPSELRTPPWPPEK